MIIDKIKDILLQQSKLIMLPNSKAYKDDISVENADLRFMHEEQILISKQLKIKLKQLWEQQFLSVYFRQKCWDIYRSCLQSTICPPFFKINDKLHDYNLYFYLNQYNISFVQLLHMERSANSQRCSHSDVNQRRFKNQFQMGPEEKENSIKRRNNLEQRGAGESRLINQLSQIPGQLQQLDRQHIIFQQICQNDSPDGEKNRQRSIFQIQPETQLILENSMIQMKMGSFDSLSRFKAILKEVKFVLNSWDLISPSIQILFQKYLATLAKFFILPQFQAIFPNELRIVKKIFSLFVIDGPRVKPFYNGEQLPEDACFRHYATMLSGNREQINFIIHPKTNKRTALTSFMGETPQYFTQQWGELFSKLENIHERQDEDTSSSAKRDPHISSGRQEQLYRISPVDLRCLGCATDFEVNRNVYNASVIEHKVSLLGNVKEIIKNSIQIKQEICGLLNNYGGIGLFDTELIVNKAIPRGSFLTETQKSTVQNNLNKIIGEIEPQPILGVHVRLTFVPVAQTPIVGNAKKYIPGLYVARLTVKPQDNTTTYIWKYEGNRILTIRKKSLFSTPDFKVILKGKILMEYIEDKQKQSQYESSLSEEERYYLVSAPCDIGHQCPLPAIGNPLNEPLKMNDEIQNIEETFRNAALILIRPEYGEIFAAALQKYGIKGHIISLSFSNLSIKGLKATQIFYHNDKFERLLDAISYKKEFEFDGRPVIMVKVTKYIKLQNAKGSKMKGIDFDNLVKWLVKVYPSERLQLFQLKKDEEQSEYYLKTESKSSLAFIYFVLNNFGQKSFLKDPAELQRLILNEDSHG